MLRKTVDSLLYRQHQEIINCKVKSESHLVEKKANTPDVDPCWYISFEFFAWVEILLQGSWRFLPVSL